MLRENLWASPEIIKCSTRWSFLKRLLSFSFVYIKIIDTRWSCLPRNRVTTRWWRCSRKKRKMRWRLRSSQPLKKIFVCQYICYVVIKTSFKIWLRVTFYKPKVKNIQLFVVMKFTYKHSKIAWDFLFLKGQDYSFIYGCDIYKPPFNNCTRVTFL